MTSSAATATRSRLGTHAEDVLRATARHDELIGEAEAGVPVADVPPGSVEVGGGVPVPVPAPVPDPLPVPVPLPVPDPPCPPLLPW